MKQTATIFLIACVALFGVLGATLFAPDTAKTVQASSDTTVQFVDFGETVNVSLGNLSLSQFDYDHIFDWEFSGSTISMGGTLASFKFSNGTTATTVDFVVRVNAPKSYMLTSYPPITYTTQKIEHGIIINGGNAEFFSVMNVTTMYDGVKRENSFNDTTVVQTASDTLTFSVYGYDYIDQYELTLDTAFQDVSIKADMSSFTVATSNSVVFQESIVSFLDVNGNVIAQVETINRYIPSDLVPNAPEINQRPFMRWTNTQGFAIDGVIPYDVTFIPLYSYDPNYTVTPPDDTQKPDSSFSFGNIFGSSTMIIIAIVLVVLLGMFLINLIKGVFRV